MKNLVMFASLFILLIAFANQSCTRHVKEKEKEITISPSLFDPDSIATDEVRTNLDERLIDTVIKKDSTIKIK